MMKKERKKHLFPSLLCDIKIGILRFLTLNNIYLFGVVKSLIYT